MFFFADLMKEGANKETIFQPLSPLGDYSYDKHWRNNTKSRVMQVKEKYVGQGNKRAMHDTSRASN